LTISLINDYVKCVSLVDDLTAVFSALADPTRRDILTRLGEREATVGDLAAPYEVSLPAVSRHLRVLEEAGLITQTRQAQWRTNHLRTEPLRQAGGWIDHLTTVWTQRFDRLDEHLNAAQQPNPDRKQP
jgi:DNA-binding transcriptional ArsR family regulator